MTQLERDLRRRYELESELLYLQQRKQQLDETLPQGKYALRQAEVAVTEYEAFGLKSFFHKLSGKWEDHHEALLRQLSAAKTELSRLKQEQADVDRRMEAVLEEKKPLDDLGDPLAAAQALDADARERITLLEAKLCTKKLIPALEGARSALEIAQEWARPQSRVDVAPGYTKNLYFSLADDCARTCYAQLERIASCGILLDIHPYFTNPTGYIVGVAAQYAQLDRINSALSAIRETQKQARELLVQLPEEEEL